MRTFYKKISIFLLLAIVLLCFSSSKAFADALPESWSGDIFAGYNKSSGNTNKSSGAISAQAVKIFDYSRILLKGDLFYSESNKKMDSQKWDALAKYLFDFGAERKWYNFYQVFVDHDYFADIDYRVTPALGIGYHIADSDDWVWDADVGAGYRITRHRINTSEDDEVPTALAHTFMKRQVFERAFISEDFAVYPGLKSGAGVLLRSETAFVNPLQENIDLEIKYIVDYNSEPAGKKKTDKQLIAGLKYRF